MSIKTAFVCFIDSILIVLKGSIDVWWSYEKLWERTVSLSLFPPFSGSSFSRTWSMRAREEIGLRMNRRLIQTTFVSTSRRSRRTWKWENDRQITIAPTIADWEEGKLIREINLWRNSIMFPWRFQDLLWCWFISKLIAFSFFVKSTNFKVQVHNNIQHYVFG